MRLAALVWLAVGVGWACGAGPPAFAEPARVAVFDPVRGTDQTRFVIDLAAYDRAARAMRDAGITVDRLTADQINDPSGFNAQRYDAIFFGGQIIPRSAIPAVKRFADEGGVLVGLGGKLPFTTAIEPGDDGKWRMSPMKPKFAWQTGEVLGHFHAKYVYKPAMHDQAERFTVTPLLKRYLPGAVDPVGKLRNWWIVPYSYRGEAGEYFPLIRSQRIDGADVTPQVFIVRRGGRHAILCLNAFFTDGGQPGTWAQSDELVVALARIAADLKHGRLDLAGELKAEVREDLGPPAPLRSRRAAKGVDPEGAPPIARWGRFDGSSFDLDPTGLPARLDPGQSVTLALPDDARDPGGPRFLRIRGAYNATGSGLRAAVGDAVLINETFVYDEASAESNHTVNAYTDKPVEFHRVVFAPGPGGALTLSNPGVQPIYFDAVQLETRAAPAPEVWVGQYAGFRTSQPDGVNTIPLDKTRSWSLMRADLRGQFVGPPGDPRRWDQLRKHLDKFVEMNPRWNLILMGTPRWAAIDAERYEQGRRDHRPHCVPPDPARYAEIVEWVADHYGQYVAVWEVWNETDIYQFWRGAPEEYLVFADHMVDVIQRKDPGKPIILAGWAHVDPEYVRTIRQSGPAAKASPLVAVHPYVGESTSWDIAIGALQGVLYNLGDDAAIYPNESGFTWRNGEWFKSGWTPQRQHDALSIAMGRTLHNDTSKLTIFLSGGDEHIFGVYDEHGEPRPAAAVLEDYVQLGRPGARRLDVSIVPADGDVPLTGVYVAGSAAPDGSVVLVVNPAQSPHHRRRVVARFPTQRPLTHAAAAAGDRPVEVALTSHDGWAEATFDVSERTVVTLTPSH